MDTTIRDILADATLAKFIGTRDRAIAKARPWSPTPLADYLRQLATTGRVVVGGRSTCGPTVDPSWRVYTAWCEVVAKAGKLGYRIEQAEIKQKNKSPTTCGGYWHEREYGYTA